MRKMRLCAVSVVSVAMLAACSGCELSSLVTNSESIAGRLTLLQGVVQGAILDYWTVLAPIVDSLPLF